MSEAMIELKNVSFSYESGREVLRDVSFSIADGESVGLIGANGAGKSTLMRILLGLLFPGSGEASVDGVRIVVSNNGPLIPPSQMELIFQPFYSTKEEGTGIGLALSRRIMELHGGTLTCDSNPPLTLFTLAFPQG